MSRTVEQLEAELAVALREKKEKEEQQERIIEEEVSRRVAAILTAKDSRAGELDEKIAHGERRLREINQAFSETATRIAEMG